MTWSRRSLQAQHTDLVVGVLMQVRDLVLADGPIDQSRVLHHRAADRLVADLVASQLGLVASCVVRVELPADVDGVLRPRDDACVAEHHLQSPVLAFVPSL